MNGLKIAFNGVAAGAVLMYFLDPARGKRRRTVLRDKAVSKWSHLNTLLDKAGRDASNRTYGLLSEIKATIPGGEENNVALAERVKSKIGRTVSHPHAINVKEENGHIELTGVVLQEEVPDLLSTVRSVKGVKTVVNRLEVYESSDHISALQGGRKRDRRLELNKQSWTPALRVAAGGVGCAIAAYSAVNRSPLKFVGAVTGAALLTRAVSNVALKDVVGVGSHLRPIEIEKTVHIDAPIREVFALWSDYRKFPLFMSHLKEVQDLGNGRSHWVAKGPGGMAVSWNAELTHNVENKLLAWKSVEGSSLETEGAVRFDEGPENSTRIGIRLSYKQPAGAVGYYVASLFGTDPKREIDDDMVRLKSLIECGKTRANGHRITKEALMTVAAS